MSRSRREFLRTSVGGASSLLLASGCGDEGEAGDVWPTSDPSESDDASGSEGSGGTESTSGSGPTSAGPGSSADDGSSDSTGMEVDCDDPFEGGEMLGLVGFVDEGSSNIGSKGGSGHDARLALDLSSVTPETLLTPNELFFVRTEYPDLLNPPDPWVISIDGLVNSTAITLPELQAMTQTTKKVCLECSGNGDFSAYGLLSAAEWSGVPVMDVLDTLNIDASATAVLISGFDMHTHVSTHSTNGAAWVYTFEDLAKAEAFFALEMNGEPLPPDHGQPVRLVAPGWYGCCNIKWVNEMRLVDDSEPATSQMIEFASRTHQTQAHALAADYSPGTMQQAAMPTRIEKWNVNGQIVYNIIGIMWGGEVTTDALAIRINGGEPQAIPVCPPQLQNLTWTLWSAPFTPPSAGYYDIDMVITDPSIPTNRLDSGFYHRTVYIDEV